MPQGQPTVVPEDGLTTRQRRNRPLVVVHTGDGKGKSTAAFGLALRGWNQGWSWSRKQGDEEDHAAAAAEGWAEIKRRIAAEEHDLLLLDEFTYPINWGWVDVDDVVETLANRPGHQHVVITGRRADPRLVEVADLVTEMTKVKHPMDVGQKGQKGIEW